MTELEKEKQKLDRSYLFKYLDIFCKEYYNPRKILTFNRPINFITGLRSCGKSTGTAGLFILDFLARGHAFCYTRRDGDTIKETAESFFTDAINIINDSSEIPYNIFDFSYKNGKYFIDAEGMPKTYCGFSVPLSKADKIKSVVQDIPVYNGVYDEFVAEKSTEYLGSRETPETEYNKFKSLFITLDRKKGAPRRNELRWFFLGNLASEYNPIFLKFNVTDYYDENANFIRPKNKLWVLEQVASVPALENENISFSKSLFDEEGSADFGKGGESSGIDYVRPIPENCQYCCTLRFKNKNFGVYREPYNYNYYIGKPKDIGMRPIALDSDSHRENDLILVTRWKDYPIINVLLEKFKRNALFFQNNVIKRTFMIYFKLMPDI